MHGHEPSKGATIDAEIKEDEEKELQRKGAYGGMDAKKNPAWTCAWTFT